MRPGPPIVASSVSSTRERAAFQPVPPLTSAPLPSGPAPAIFTIAERVRLFFAASVW